MKRRTAATTALLLAGLFAAYAGPDPGLKTHPDSAGWADLFAPDLSNALFPPGVWAWNGGVLSPKGKDEVIWTKRSYKNFILDLEFQLEPAANSGVLVYNNDPKNWIPNTVEIQVLDDAAPKWSGVPGNWLCGGIFGHSTPLASAVKKPGEWNRMTIRCQGQHISVLLNGKLVTNANLKNWTSGKKNPDGSDIPDFEPRPFATLATEGRIGLQGAHGGIPTHFRNLKIKQFDF